MVPLRLTPYVMRRLITLTRQTRDAQRLYFKTKSPIDLGLAKRQEQVLDRLLAAVDIADCDVLGSEVSYVAPIELNLPWDNQSEDEKAGDSPVF